MPVVATAGHVDHGKSTLIRYLTGTDPDRLPEEKAREMTIDLGFASLALPSGRQIGLVDVPGHQRFIHNMLAGMGGIDAALLVVDLTEGWMPQTEEHVEILALLGIPCAACALTKADLVDGEWVDLVASETREHLARHGYENVQLVPVAAPSGQGLADLIRALDACLSALPVSEDRGWPRLFIDRVIRMRGAGVVVTGTLTGGALEAGQEVAIQPGGRKARVRGLQSHHRPVASIMAGSRAAVNLLGVDADQLNRGQAVVRPDDVLLSQAPIVRLVPARAYRGELRTGQRLTCFVGTAEVEGMLRLLDAGRVPPGEAALGQLWLERPLPLRWRDRMILREPGRRATAAGCHVADPHAERVRGRKLIRWVEPDRRSGYETLLGAACPPLELEPIRSLASGELAQAVESVLSLRGALSPQDLARHLHAPQERVRDALARLEGWGRAVELGPFVASPRAWSRLAQRARDVVDAHHRSQPLSPGLPRQTLHSALGLDPRLFEASLQRLVTEGAIEWDGATVRSPGFRPHLEPPDEAQSRRLMALLDEAGFKPPTVDELTSRHGFAMQLISLLVARGDLVRINQDLAVTSAAARRLVEVVRQVARRSGGFVDPSAVRDATGSSRRFVIPFLEYLDRTGVTRRTGDRRELAWLPQAAPQGDRGTGPAVPPPAAGGM